MIGENKMKISVIVPMYNVEAYIEDCVESLCSQKVDKEIILVDDGSTDRTYEIALKLRVMHPEIVLMHQENHGQGTARNVALREAKGEYILFCDSDDTIAENSLPLLVDLCDQHELDYIKTGWLTIYPDKQIENRPQGIPLNTVMTSVEYFNYAIKTWYNVVPFNGIYRRQFLTSNNIWYPENIQFEDNTFALKVYLSEMKARMMQIDNLFYIVRVSTNSTTTAKPKSKKINDQLKNIYLMEEFISRLECSKEIKRKAKIAVSSLTSTMVWYYYRMDLEEREKVYIPKDILIRAYRNPQEITHAIKLFMFCHCRWLLQLIYH